MCSAELFGVLGVHWVRESCKGVGRGVFQPGPAKHPGELLMGKGHGNHLLTDHVPDAVAGWPGPAGRSCSTAVFALRPGG